MITLKNVTKKYGRKVAALKDCSVTFETESVAVLGEPGAGKTTLAKILCGMLTPSVGMADIDGAELTAREAADAIGYMPSQLPLSKSLTLAEALEYTAKLRRLGTDAVDTALSEADMDNDMADVPIGKLNGLGKKLAALAFAILGSPKYLVLDQPVLGLGADDEKAFIDLLSELSEKYVFIYLSDTLDDAHRLCKKALILHGGRSVAFGTFDDLIYSKPEYTEYKIRARGDSDALKQALDESEDITAYKVMVTSSGTALIELTLRAAENAEAIIRSVIGKATQRIIEIRKTDSPVEKALIRLLELQAAKDEARCKESEEQASPVKVTKELIASVIGNADPDSASFDESTVAENDGAETEDDSRSKDGSEDEYGGSDSTLF